jgi:hypothetical protein
VEGPPVHRQQTREALKLHANLLTQLRGEIADCGLQLRRAGKIDARLVAQFRRKRGTERGDEKGSAIE